MALPSRAEFTRQALAAGFDEVLERQWAPLTVVDEHSHPFALQAILVQGEMWLAVDGAMQHLQVGDRFTLERDIAHAERYGDAGAIYWVARKN